MDQTMADYDMVTRPNSAIRGLNMFSSTSDVNRRNLFEDSSNGRSSAGSGNTGTPITPACIPGTRLDFGMTSRTSHTISPVSRTRTVATGLLDFREELEAEEVNLNKPADVGSTPTPPKKPPSRVICG